MNYDKTFKEIEQNKINYINSINDDSNIKNILYNTTWGRTFILRNLDDVIAANNNNINIILEYVDASFESNIDFIKKLSVYRNLHIRYIFMKYIVEKRSDKMEQVYDDIMNYLSLSKNQEEKELMSIEDICNLAICILHSNIDKELWYKLKEYILTNYKNNNLARLLLNIGSNHNFQHYDEDRKEFEKDADRLFITSRNYKNVIYEYYKKHLSKKVIEDFEHYLTYFNIYGTPGNLFYIFYYELWDELIGCIDKYLAISENKNFCYIQGGTTTSCYRIGDYVFKIVHEKYSRADPICPNLYLIIKNLEEHYIRSKDGYVIAGFEVQKYLSRKDIEINVEHIKLFEKSLERLGYYMVDSLIHRLDGEMNCALLDNYKEADCNDPENLPNWFKETPLVLIDRDLVYKIEDRQLQQKEVKPKLKKYGKEKQKIKKRKKLPKKQ